MRLKGQEEQMKFKETPKDIDWVDYEYPDLWYIVEVTYSGDVAIAYARAKRNDPPKERDNAKGFTANFTTYEAAKRYAANVAAELNIPF